MKNCLVTKLKSVVLNDSLLRLGELPINIGAGSFLISPSEETTVRADKNVLSLTNGGTGTNSVTIPAGTISAGTTVYVSGECTVYIPQYIVQKISISPKNDIDIKYLGVNANTQGLYITIPNNTSTAELGTLPKKCVQATLDSNLINFNFDSYPKLRVISANNLFKTIEYNVEEIAQKCPELRTFGLFTTADKITGDFEDFGTLKHIEAISGFRGGGTMEGFVAAQRVASGDRAARTTGSISLIWCDSITFQGVGNIVQGTAKTLSWTANTITFDGTTIEA